MLALCWLMFLVATFFVTLAAIISPVTETKLGGRVSKESMIYILSAIAMWVAVAMNLQFTITVNT